MKWSVPHFEYRGTRCSMAAFKAHCMFGFGKESLVLDGARLRRIASVADLPPDRTLAAWVKKAARVNEQGVNVERTARRSSLKTPPDFLAAVKRNPKALATFRGVQPEPPARVRRVDRRRQGRGHAAAPDGNGRRVDGGGEGEKLEVPVVHSWIGE